MKKYLFISVLIVSLISLQQVSAQQEDLQHKYIREHKLIAYSCYDAEAHKNIIANRYTLEQFVHCVYTNYDHDLNKGRKLWDAVLFWQTPGMIEYAHMIEGRGSSPRSNGNSKGNHGVDAPAYGKYEHYSQSATNVVGVSVD